MEEKGGLNFSFDLPKIIASARTSTNHKFRSMVINISNVVFEAISACIGVSNFKWVYNHISLKY